MPGFYLEFNELEAYEYQAQMAEQLIEEQEKVLENLQQEEIDAEAMQCFLEGQGDTWEPMQKFLKLPDLEDFPRRLKFQKLVIEFLQEKRTALRFMITGTKRPEIWATQHSNEMRISEQLVKLDPIKGPAVLETVYDKLRMYQETLRPRIFLVRKFETYFNQNYNDFSLHGIQFRFDR